MAKYQYLEMCIDQPFHLGYSLESGQVFRWQNDQGWYRGIIAGDLVLLNQDGPVLKVIYNLDATENILAEIESFFRLDDEIDHIYSVIDTDERMNIAINEYRGLRILRQDPWECLISFICSANSNIPRISSTMEIIAYNYGERRNLMDHVGYVFPSPSKLASIGEDELRMLKMGFRAKYVARVAEIIASGDIDLYSLKDIPYREAKEILISLPGVGNKVADCVLLFSLEKLEACPVDRWVKRALEDWYSLESNLKYDDFYGWAFAKWGLFAGYAQQYLFQSKRLMA
jgi:N-glycosylase/DNA lyase